MKEELLSNRKRKWKEFCIRETEGEEMRMSPYESSFPSCPPFRQKVV
jgi:hypothetical protein